MGRMKDLFGELPNPQQTMRFDGKTYDPKRDQIRLKGQMLRVYTQLKDGQWHTLRELSDKTGDPEASVSARIRDLRKERFGSHVIEHDRVDKGLWRYRMEME